MFLDLKACYSPSDIVFVISLFILTMFAIGLFTMLMSYLVRDAIYTVEHLRKKDKAS